MRLHKTILSSLMAAAALWCSACSAIANGGTSYAADGQLVIYRGSVTETKQDGSIEVAQLAGHDYGYASIIFRIDENTDIDTSGGTPNRDAYVEVAYNGSLSGSTPPRASALSITVIAPQSAGVVQNGTVQDVEQTGDGWRVYLLPHDATSAPEESLVLSLPADGLVGLNAEELDGAEVSAVTRGIVTASLPPQMPAVVLLPYTT